MGLRRSTSSHRNPASVFWKISTLFSVSRCTWIAISPFNLSGNQRWELKLLFVKNRVLQFWQQCPPIFRVLFLSPCQWISLQTTVPVYCIYRCTLMSKLENTSEGVWIVLSAPYYERVLLLLLQSFITRFQNAHRFNFYTKVWNLGILSVVNASKMFWHLACTCSYLADSWLTAPRPWTFETATDNQTTWSLLSEDCLALFGFSCMF